jgi:hypothetical protein
MAEDLLKGVYARKDYKVPSDLKDIRPLIDYTRDFVRYYFEDQNKLLLDEETEIIYDDNAINYIANRLYQAKGKLEVFNVLYTLLNIETEYYYTDPHTLNIKFPTLSATNLAEFYEKFFNMLNVLLFYVDADIKIDILNLYVINKYISIIEFSVNSFNLTNFDVSDY